MAEKTQWFHMNQKPSRQGEYEGREKGSRLRVPVYWRKLTDESEPGWYFDSGYFGPFHLWKDASNDISAWRGLTKKATK